MSSRTSSRSTSSSSNTIFSTSARTPAASGPPVPQLARAASEQNTRPMVICPPVSPPLVNGPPVSSDLNCPNVIPYVLVRPSWQNGRCGHSGGPPRIEDLPEHLLAKSDSDFSTYLSARAEVTANAFWSAAWDGLPKVRPVLVPRS